jgi:hypothetical protein
LQRTDPEWLLGASLSRPIEKAVCLARGIAEVVGLSNTNVNL